MSDRAAAQREARRRKITQNAQARMNKLLGRSDVTETEDQDIKISAPEVSPDTSSSKDDEIQLQPPSPAQTSPYNLRRRPQRSDFSSTPSPETVTQEELTTEPIIFPVETSSPVSEEYEPNFEFHHERPDAAADDTETAADLDSKSKTQDPSKTEVQPPSTFDAKALELLRVVVCVMTSLFSRSVLALGFGLFMVESIFLPFLAMELFYTYLMETSLKDVSPVQSQATLVSAALMLCGMKPELMGVYHKIMSHIAVIASDFSIYFFSFVIWNALLS